MADGCRFRRALRGLDCFGAIAGPKVGDALPPGFEWFAAGHPDPNQASVDAGRRALAMAAECTGERVLVVLLSGGASALLAVPAAGLTLAEKMATTRAVMQAGAAIDELNCVRKHLSRLKGGSGAAAERVVTLAISDVHGPVPDDPSVIGSGPTVPDPTTYADALAMVRRVQADERRGVSHTAVRHLERGTRGLEPETIKPGDPRLAGAELHIIANRLTAIEGARQAASALGYEVVVLPGATTGEARDAAGIFFDAAAPFVSRTTGPLACSRLGRRPSASPAPAAAAAIRSLRWPWPADWHQPRCRCSSPVPAPMGSMVRPMRPGQWSMRLRWTGPARVAWTQSPRSPTTTRMPSSRRSAI